MPSSRQILSTIAAAVLTSSVNAAMGPAFSTGPVAEGSWIREATSTLVLPKAPSESSGDASLWVGMGNSNGDLIQSIADNWKSDKWNIYAYTLLSTSATTQMPVQSEGENAQEGDKITMHCEQKISTHALWTHANAMTQTSLMMQAATTLKLSPSTAAKSLRCRPTTAMPRAGAALSNVPRRTAVLLARTSGSTLPLHWTLRTPTTTRLWVRVRVLLARCLRMTVVLHGLLPILRFLSSLLVSLRRWLRNRFPLHGLVCACKGNSAPRRRGAQGILFLFTSSKYILYGKKYAYHSCKKDHLTSMWGTVLPKDLSF